MGSSFTYQNVNVQGCSHCDSNSPDCIWDLDNLSKSEIPRKVSSELFRSILNISFEDRRTNVSGLEQAKMSRIEANIKKNQFWQSGHLVKIDDTRLLKQIFYSQRKEGNRKSGGQVKKFKDGWKSSVMDRTLWRYFVRDGTTIFEFKESARLEGKRRRRKTDNQGLI